MRPCLLALLLPLGLAACDQANMVSQPKAKTWDRNPFFPQGQTMRLPPPGTVARAAPDRPVPQPAAASPALLVRGQERYDVFCTPCHGAAGLGDGMIVQRGYPRSPAFDEARLRAAPAQHFYDVISNGKGNMLPYAAQVPPADRWAIVAYIRALQLSQGATLASLPAEDQAKVAAAGGEPTPGGAR
ncbi:c-type cytochrome [Methylobacterium indicum]|uniref:Cytochrome C n=1 Tax=Methylobacterium indicum TaxID=1775910 RepID=A0ABR5H8X9_9HYPH|nr:cytochrome c [Methylobacterium indicum]KMO18271.1 cytochrome C [Methylobacterium indicum]KMO20413.1 cytochrome C [Methylobacterium indicum]